MRAYKGFSLLEVLVTLIIVVFGLLGIAGILLNSLKSNYNSYARTQANLLANDMLERVRANPTPALAGLYTLSMGGTPSGTGVPVSDLNQWLVQLSTTLPSGQGSVAVDTAIKQVRVSVRWDNSRVKDGSATETITMVTGL